ncbi:hypothetical protein Tco_1503200 [Tanacetum coccineum]
MGLLILQSIDQGPFEFGTIRNTLRTTPEGGVLLGPERPRTYEVLSSELTKEDRESHLYDEFERFKMLPDDWMIRDWMGHHIQIYGGNDESKWKMQKYILKQQFEGYLCNQTQMAYIKAMTEPKSFCSHLEIHGGRTKPGVDSLSFDDLYNNLRVFENDVKGSTASSSSTQNVAFISENTSSTNDLDEFDLEEMDLKWQVAMISMRMKKFYKKTGRKLQFDAKEPVGFDKTKVECYNCHKTPFLRRGVEPSGNQESKEKMLKLYHKKGEDPLRSDTERMYPNILHDFFNLVHSILLSASLSFQQFSNIFSATRNIFHLAIHKLALVVFGKLQHQRLDVLYPFLVNCQPSMDLISLYQIPFEFGLANASL